MNYELLERANLLKSKIEGVNIDIFDLTALKTDDTIEISAGEWSVCLDSYGYDNEIRKRIIEVVLYEIKQYRDLLKKEFEEI